MAARKNAKKAARPTAQDRRAQFTKRKGITQIKAKGGGIGG